MSFNTRRLVAWFFVSALLVQLFLPSLLVLAQSTRVEKKNATVVLLDLLSKMGISSTSESPFAGIANSLEVLNKFAKLAQSLDGGDMHSHINFFVATLISSFIDALKLVNKLSPQETFSSRTLQELLDDYLRIVDKRLSNRPGFPSILTIFFREHGHQMTAVVVSLYAQLPKGMVVQNYYVSLLPMMLSSFTKTDGVEYVDRETVNYFLGFPGQVNESLENMVATFLSGEHMSMFSNLMSMFAAQKQHDDNREEL